MKYQCFICKDEVSDQEITSPLDPCAVVLIANFDRSREDQKEQQFFCHLECFRRVVDNDGIMYIMDSDFPTIGESAEDLE